MDAIELKQLMSARPFVPFRIRVSGGFVYMIRNEASMVVGNAMICIKAEVREKGDLVEKVLNIALSDVEKAIPVSS